MKYISAILVMSFSTLAFANQVVCLESGQTAMFLTAEYQESKDPKTPHKVEISAYAPDGTVTKETIEGREPELGIMNATDEEGQSLVLITSMIPDNNKLNVRILVCHKNQ